METVANATNDPTAKQAGVVDDPDHYSEDPIKVIRQPLHAGKSEDRVGFHAFAANRYGNHVVSGSTLLREKIPFINLQQSVTADIYEFLKTNTRSAEFMNRYEAYQIEDMTLTVQYAANSILQHGVIRYGYVMDPERTLDAADPKLDVGSTNTPLRYTDARINRVGDHFSFPVPVPRKKYYTGGPASRFTSPGRFFFALIFDDAAPNDADGSSLPPSAFRVDQQLVATLTARISGICPTIRTAIQQNKTTVNLQTLRFDGAYEVEFDASNSAAFVADLKPDELSAVDKGTLISPGVVYLASPAYMQLKVIQAESPVFDETAYRFTIPVTKMEYIFDGSAGTYKYRVLTDVTRIAQVMGKSEKSTWVAAIEEPFLGLATYVVSP